MLHVCPPELKRLYREGKVLPFVGAGVSMSVSWTDKTGNEIRGPSWAQMVNEAARILGFEDPELLRMRGTDLQILEYFAIKKKNFAPLINWMVRNIDAQLGANKFNSSCKLSFAGGVSNFLHHEL